MLPLRTVALRVGTFLRVALACHLVPQNHGDRLTFRCLDLAARTPEGQSPLGTGFDVVAILHPTPPQLVATETTDDGVGRLGLLPPRPLLHCHAPSRFANTALAAQVRDIIVPLGTPMARPTTLEECPP